MCYREHKYCSETVHTVTCNGLRPSIAACFTPMLAASLKPEHLQSLNFPLLATPKIDGIRAVVVNGRLLSRSLKEIPNTGIRRALEGVLPDGADGELYCGSFNSTVNAVMSKNGPIPEGIKYYWFDWVKHANSPYKDRVLSVQAHVMLHDTLMFSMPEGIRVVPLIPTEIHCLAGLVRYESHIVDTLGFEGVVLRDPNGRYKYGRSTIRDRLMTKLKRCHDSEAIVTGTEELVHANGAGRSNLLGAIVATLPNGTAFKIGTGFTAEQRQTLWNDRDNLLGRLVKYRCALSDYGVPKSAVFIGMRHTDEI